MTTAFIALTSLPPHISKEEGRMPDFSQSPQNLDPPTVVDHVLLPVADLEAGARTLRQHHGLQAIPGGRHPKLGTANMIVPLGRQYLELVAIADPQEAATSRLGKRVTRALDDGRMFVDWALRTNSVVSLRAKLLAAGWELPPPWEGSRRAAWPAGCRHRRG